MTVTKTKMTFTDRMRERGAGAVMEWTLALLAFLWPIPPFVDLFGNPIFWVAAEIMPGVLILLRLMKVEDRDGKLIYWYFMCTFTIVAWFLWTQGYIEPVILFVIFSLRAWWLTRHDAEKAYIAFMTPMMPGVAALLPWAAVDFFFDSNLAEMITFSVFFFVASGFLRLYPLEEWPNSPFGTPPKHNDPGHTP